MMAALSVLLSIFLSFVTTVFVANALDGEEYGRYVLYLSAIQVSLVLSVEPVRLWILRFGNTNRTDVRSAFSLQLIFICCSWIFIYIFVSAVPVTGVFSLASFFYCCLLIALQSMFEYAAAFTRSIRANLLFSRLQLTRAVLSLVLIVAAAHKFGDVNSALLATALSFFFALLSVTPIFYIFKPAEFDRQFLKSVEKYGFPLSLSSLGFPLALYLARTYVAQVGGVVAVGAFSFTIDVLQKTFGAICLAVNQLSFQRSVMIWNEKKDISAVFSDNVYVFVAILTPCTIGFYLISDHISAVFVPSYARKFFVENVLYLSLFVSVVLIKQYVIDINFAILNRTIGVILTSSLLFCCSIVAVAFAHLLYGFSAPTFTGAIFLGATFSVVTVICFLRFRRNSARITMHTAAVPLAALLMYLAVSALPEQTGIRAVILDVVVGGTVYLGSLTLYYLIVDRQRLALWRGILTS